MAVSMSPKQKVYQGVLTEIRKFIEDNDLKPGDKLPSERELAEKLEAGRSSVREALRAMELLGLIETRRGEGTYLSTYRPYQTVELLSSFILQEKNTISDLALAKQVLEKEAAKLAFDHIKRIDIEELRALLHDSNLMLHEKHEAFFNYLFNKTENFLLTKIWNLMEDFSRTVNKHYYMEEFYTSLITYYSKKRYDHIEDLFLTSRYKEEV
ncbi:FadR/GntR family transcriptional regulator [Virgibacillus byunsanensis]|uniref:FadR/GntR family transcriptional regulator n=1 Tax=Virgibacillus byunsanensis TaxID=570945 RepID=A0ABW3LI91_9BACI